MRCKVVRQADLWGFKLCNNCAMLCESVLTQVGRISVRGFPSNVISYIGNIFNNKDRWKYNTVVMYFLWQRISINFTLIYEWTYAGSILFPILKEAHIIIKMCIIWLHDLKLCFYLSSFKDMNYLLCSYYIYIMQMQLQNQNHIANIDYKSYSHLVDFIKMILLLDSSLNYI